MCCVVTPTNWLVVGLLSTVLFHRLFGPSVPQTREVLGVTYPCVVNSSLDSLIEEKTSEILRSIRPQQAETQIGIQFFEKQPGSAKKKQTTSWFSTTSPQLQQDVCWEQWVIRLHLLDGKNDREHEINRKKTEKQLVDTLMAIVNTASTNKDHIPPITTTDSTPFPYKILLLGNGSSRNSTTEDETWGAVFKKMLE